MGMKASIVNDRPSTAVPVDRLIRFVLVRAMRRRASRSGEGGVYQPTRSGLCGAERVATRAGISAP